MELMTVEKCSVSSKQHTDIYVQIGIVVWIFVNKTLT